jgi:Arm DNA-binding domain
LASLKQRFNLPTLFPAVGVDDPMKLTVKATDALRLAAGERDKIWFDDDIAGWGLRVRDGGKRVWIFQYAIGSRTRRLTFGTYPAMSVPDARLQAEQLHAQTKLGRDPAQEKADAKARAGETFGDCLGSYLHKGSSARRP